MLGFLGNASRRRAAIKAVAALIAMDGSLRDQGLDAPKLAAELVAGIWVSKPLRSGRQVFGYPGPIAVAVEALSNGLSLPRRRPDELEIVARALVRTTSHLREPSAAKELSDLDYELIQTVTAHLRSHPVIQAMARGEALKSACIEYAAMA